MNVDGVKYLYNFQMLMFFIWLQWIEWFFKSFITFVHIYSLIKMFLVWNRKKTTNNDYHYIHTHTHWTLAILTRDWPEKKTKESLEIWEYENNNKNNISGARFVISDCSKKHNKHHHHHYQTPFECVSMCQANQDHHHHQNCCCHIGHND